MNTRKADGKRPITLIMSTAGLTLLASLTSSCLPPPANLDGAFPLALMRAREDAVTKGDLAGASPGTVATPDFSPAPGVYNDSGQTITITDATPGATIHYTTDGLPPTTGSAVYSSPVPIGGGFTMKAIAVKTGMENSTEATGVYGMDVTPPTVYSTDPATGGTDISPLGATITVVFSEPMNTTLTPILVTDVYCGAGWWCNVPNSGSTLVWMNPTTLSVHLSWIRFPENSMIRWLLDSAGLQDQAGNPISGFAPRSFTTGSDGTTLASGFRDFTGPTAHASYTGDYTTTDNVTGLVWKTCDESHPGGSSCTGSAGNSMWQDALNGCSYLNTANAGVGYASRDDWRLPTETELATLPNASLNSPALEPGYFPNTNSSCYWTATKVSASTDSVFCVSFANYGSVTSASWGSFVPLRCVSSGP